MRADLTSSFTTAIRAIAADAIPDDVRAIAKLCVLDWLGVTIAGADQPLVSMLAAEVHSGEAGACTLIRRSGRTSPVNAALINGAAGDALDYSDNVRAMNGHATATVLPAALAAAETCGSSGDALLRAFVVGVEAACRLGRLVGEGVIAAGFHPTAVVGPLGSAAAAAQLLKLDDAQWPAAFGIAATLAGGLAASVGTMCKPLHAGTAASNGLLAARLARRGFTGCATVLEHPAGFLAAHTTAANERALEECAGRFFTREILMKQHAVCALAHGSIENMLRLRRSAAFANDEIKSVKLAIAESSARVCDIAVPKTGLEVKFSARTLAAMVLCDLPTDDPAAFGDAPIRSPAVVDLRDRVVLEGRPELPVGLSIASIELHDGRVFETRTDEREIEVDLDLRQARACAKFGALSGPYVRPQMASELQSLVLALEQADAFKSLLQLLRDIEIRA